MEVEFERVVRCGRPCTVQSSAYEVSVEIDQ